MTNCKKTFYLTQIIDDFFALQHSISLPFAISRLISFETNDGTAVDGLDYSHKKGFVTFQPYEKKQYVEIEIIDEHDWEMNEIFLVHLRPGPDNRKAYIGTKKAAQVTIENDDCKFVFYFKLVGGLIMYRKG